MAKSHKWRITVEKNGLPIVFTDPNGGKALDHIPFQGTISEVLMKIKKYMINERKKQDKLERDLGKSS